MGDVDLSEWSSAVGHPGVLRSVHVNIKNVNVVRQGHDDSARHGSRLAFVLGFSAVVVV